MAAVSVSYEPKLLVPGAGPKYQELGKREKDFWKGSKAFNHIRIPTEKESDAWRIKFTFKAKFPKYTVSENSLTYAKNSLTYTMFVIFFSTDKTLDSLFLHIEKA